jgi:hypothetical protein
VGGENRGVGTQFAKLPLPAQENRVAARAGRGRYLVAAKRGAERTLGSGRAESRSERALGPLLCAATRLLPAPPRPLRPSRGGRDRARPPPASAGLCSRMWPLRSGVVGGSFVAPG